MKGEVMKTTKIVFACMVLLIAGLTAGMMLFASGDKGDSADSVEQYEIVMVVKLEGVSWFDDMRKGIQEFDKDYPDVKAYQIGHDTGDPAAQVALVEDLVAKGVDAILVVPNDPKSLEPVFKKANERGILTFTHEAPTIQNVSYDIEAFDNAAFGENMMKILGKSMDGYGKYGAIVGLLTMDTHVAWANAAVAYQKEHFPDMELVTVPYIEDDNDQQLAYQKIQELLKAYPDLRGVLGCTGGSAPAGGLVIEERDLMGKVWLSGLTLPSMGGPYLKSGAIQSIHFWSPADAGYVTARVAYEVLKGNKITAGMDLGRPGYESVMVEGKIIMGEADITATADNVDNWDF
jgi:simple sugar transport system substrate-binding protein